MAGPVVSLLLAGGFGALWLLGRFLGLQPATVVAGWLGGINLMLALFNLIPGFPLDGGRVFRAIVWGVTGSLTRATQIAGRIWQMTLERLERTIGRDPTAGGAGTTSDRPGDVRDFRMI